MHDLAHNFLHSAFKTLAPYEELLHSLSIDHLCFRTESLADYETTKSHFNGLGKLLIESIIGGRSIATYQLSNPIEFKNYYIDLIEVPAPKASKFTKRGFEHMEFVIPHSFEWVEKHFANESISTRGVTKTINPEIEVAFKNFAIKFHHKSLAEVIRIEKNGTVMKVLSHSKILEILAPYRPLISGTLPLGIETNESDLDILCEAQDLDQFERFLSENFSCMGHFKIKRTMHQQRETVVANFNCDQLPLEIFAQNLNVYEQQANLHFLAEAKILKLLGDHFGAQVRKLKQSGVKTEPAFGKLLGLQRPYEELLELALESEQALFERFKDYSSKSLPSPH